MARLAGEPTSFDFHVALRRVDASLRQGARLGEAVSPAGEPVRLGQAPSANFAPSAVSAFEPSSGDRPARLLVGFFGMWGPQGPLPAHLTEFAADRSRQAGDHALGRFVDLFHHRLLLAFHRAWAKANPTASIDRPQADGFATYVGACMGLARAATRGRDSLPDHAKLYYAGRFAGPTRNAEGLCAILGDYFGVPTAIEEFVGDWLRLPADSRWALGVSRQTGALGRTAMLGAATWLRTHRFRVVLGPLSRAQYDAFLPRSAAVSKLVAAVRLYTNDEWDWDLRLIIAPEAIDPFRLGPGARLGWTTRLGAAYACGEDLVVDPARGHTRRIRRDARWTSEPMHSASARPNEFPGHVPISRGHS